MKLYSLFRFRISYIILITFLGVFPLLPQTAILIYTHNGSPVFDVVDRPEMSWNDIVALDYQTTQAYPLASFLSNSSTTYNCHCYAFWKTEGGNNCWIGWLFATSEDIFWNDGSFYEVSTQSAASRVSYRPDIEANHSAITTSTNNTFISKWGEGPLMEHPYSYCPYWTANSTYLVYYVSSQNPATPLEINQLSNNQYHFFNDKIDEISSKYILDYSTTQGVKK